MGKWLQLLWVQQSQHNLGAKRAALSKQGSSQEHRALVVISPRLYPCCDIVCGPLSCCCGPGGPKTKTLASRSLGVYALIEFLIYEMKKNKHVALLLIIHSLASRTISQRRLLLRGGGVSGESSLNKKKKKFTARSVNKPLQPRLQPKQNTLCFLTSLWFFRAEQTAFGSPHGVRH